VQKTWNVEVKNVKVSFYRCLHCKWILRCIFVAILFVQAAIQPFVNTLGRRNLKVVALSFNKHREWISIEHNVEIADWLKSVVCYFYSKHKLIFLHQEMSFYTDAAVAFDTSLT
jgi:hypothetical protein